MGLPDRLNRYRFHSDWTVVSSFEPLFEVLSDIGSYPLWWKEVRRVDLIDDLSCHVTIRAELPYSLRFVMTQEVVDEERGYLRAMLTGDLDGWSAWTVKQEDGRYRLLFDEEVTVRRPLLRVLAPIGRPVFRANHALMMRNARRGLQAHLDDLGGPR
ncbi:MAG: SRPBCC family protein [Actinomycetota bacterium]